MKRRISLPLQPAGLLRLVIRFITGHKHHPGPCRPASSQLGEVPLPDCEGHGEFCDCEDIPPEGYPFSQALVVGCTHCPNSVSSAMHTQTSDMGSQTPEEKMMIAPTDHLGDSAHAFDVNTVAVVETDVDPFVMPHGEEVGEPPLWPLLHIEDGMVFHQRPNPTQRPSIQYLPTAASHGEKYADRCNLPHMGRSSPGCSRR